MSLSSNGVVRFFLYLGVLTYSQDHMPNSFNQLTTCSVLCRWVVLFDQIKDLNRSRGLLHRRRIVVLVTFDLILQELAEFSWCVSNGVFESQCLEWRRYCVDFGSYRRSSKFICSFSASVVMSELVRKGTEVFNLCWFWAISQERVQISFGY